MIQIYTGDGKGKTTAAVGLAVRAVGAGFKVYFWQFCKAQPSSEVAVLNKLGVDIRRFGQDSFINPKNPSEEDILAAKRGLDEFASLVGVWLTKPVQDLVSTLLILDEILIAVLFKLISEADVLNLIESCPKDVELVLTGRGATPRIIELADLVTEMSLVKHPYKESVNARVGIEY